MYTGKILMQPAKSSEVREIETETEVGFENVGVRRCKPKLPPSASAYLT